MLLRLTTLERILNFHFSATVSAPKSIHNKSYIAPRSSSSLGTLRDHGTWCNEKLDKLAGGAR